MKHIRKRNLFILLISAALLIFAACVSYAETDSLCLKRIGKIASFKENEFLVDSPESGFLRITIHDDITTYRVLEQRIESGETKITWDGCGFNQEILLYHKLFTVTAVLFADSGQEYSYSFDTTVIYRRQALQFALPSSDTVYLQKKDDWFLETKTALKGTVIIELYRSIETEENPAYTYKATTSGGGIDRITFSKMTGKNIPQAGTYSVRVYEKSKPEYTTEFSLTVSDQKPEEYELCITGRIMPDSGMDDSEIWELMMQPSVIVDIGSFKHQKVYSQPDEKSDSLGTIHGQSQAVEVIDIQGEWAFIGAWNHEEAEYVEGWVPTKKLKVVEPQKKFGLLVNKQEQTLTVLCEGRKVDTLLVSTGRPEKHRLYQETSAGSFLTGYHQMDFSSNGKKYVYVIQYDGGNLLHQLPYQWGDGKMDFELGRGYLGAKASHACIRIQSSPGEGGINAYWLWTHIPYHTRVIVMDDPAERRAERDLINGTLQTLGPNENPETDEESNDDHRVSITLAGFIQADESLSASDQEAISAAEEAHALDGFFEPLTDLVYDHEGFFLLTDESTTTGRILSSKGIKNLGTEKEAIRTTVSGHTFAFMFFTEDEYLKNPEIINERIEAEKKENCEYIIALCRWGAQGSTHSVLQEAMAHRLIRAGADAVVGNTPHTVQGIQYFLEKPIVYSLGDLLASNVKRSRPSFSAMLQIAFDFSEERSRPDVRIIPLSSGKIGADGEIIYPAPELPESADVIYEALCADSTVLLKKSGNRIVVMNQ